MALLFYTGQSEGMSFLFSLGNLDMFGAEFGTVAIGRYDIIIICQLFTLLQQDSFPKILLPYLLFVYPLIRFYQPLLFVSNLIIIFFNKMLPSHFFPRNFCGRRAVSIIDRRPSLGIHSFVASREKQKQKNKQDASDPTIDKQLQSRHKSLNMRISIDRKQDKMVERIEGNDENNMHKFNVRKKTLYVKGFCKKPSAELTLNPYHEAVEARQIISSNCRRISRSRNMRRDRMGTSIPVQNNGKNFKLTKRKSRQTSVFRGWEINYEDFNDF